MLSARLAGYLRYFETLALQPANRWDGFDLGRSDGRTTELYDQVLYIGCAMAVLGKHPDASPEERSRCYEGLVMLGERMLQRRVWATWATETEREGLSPNPVREGYIAYIGALSMLLGLQAVLSDALPYMADPFILHWSSDARYSYSYEQLATILWRHMRSSPDSAVAGPDDQARPACMAQLLWSNRLYDQATGETYTLANDKWLTTMQERLALRGPRMFGRGVLAESYHVRRRRASFSSDELEDAWALGVTAALAPELIGGLAQRHWPRVQKLCNQRANLAVAFSYLLAIELGEAAQAAALLSYAEKQLGPSENEQGFSYSNTPAAPWVTALYAIGEAGGLGQLLKIEVAVPQ